MQLGTKSYKPLFSELPKIAYSPDG